MDSQKVKKRILEDQWASKTTGSVNEYKHQLGSNYYFIFLWGGGGPQLFSDHVKIKKKEPQIRKMKRKTGR